MKSNLLLNTDSYKCSHYLQYPPGTTNIFSYIESRGGIYNSTLFVGIQAFIKEYLTKPITRENIEEAEDVLNEHGLPFNKEGWEYILETHKGKLPIIINSVPEGTLVKNHNVLLTIENWDPKCFWLTSYLETSLLRAIWYPSTVATNSFAWKLIICNWLIRTGTPSELDYKLHDFGSRGVSSLETSGIGGFAHLVNFKGTDNLAAIRFAKEYYNCDMAGYSVPAGEHSSITSWGRENEIEAYRNMIRQFSNHTVSIVADSYNIFEACKMFGTELKQDLIDNNVKLVVRPDSGNPETVTVQCLKILDEYFGHTVNEKGCKVLNDVAILYGDGINGGTIDAILFCAYVNGFSADNLLFGSGGALLQDMTRDTFKFAMKCSAAKIDGEWREVYKDPITDSVKASKRGRISLYKDENNEFYTSPEDIHKKSELTTVYHSGILTNELTLSQIRETAKYYFEKKCQNSVWL